MRSNWFNIPLLMLLCLVTALSSCNKGGTPIFNFDLEVPLEFAAGQDPIETRTYPVYNVLNFLQAELDQRGLSIDDISSIQAGQGILVADSPNVDYSGFNSVIINAINITDQTDIKEMYYQDFIQLNHTGDLKLLSSISELKPIMANGTFHMEVKVRMRSVVPFTTRHKLKMTIEVFDE